MNRKRVGIVGAGQLGRMLALAGYPLGIECRVLDRGADAPAAQLAKLVLGELDDIGALGRLAASVDVLTLEIENVDVVALESIGHRVAVYPPPRAVAAAQDRLSEKTLFRSLGIPTANFVPIYSERDLLTAADTLGWPIVLKTRRMGYDGRGQRIVDSAAGLESAWAELGRALCIAEAWVKYEREVSLIAVQGADDQRAYYPLAENVHRSGILHTTFAPFAEPALQKQAEEWLAAIMAELGYRGVLTVEFFHTKNGLVANEMAPRVHNSGHWTIEGAETSQFENHLRAVLGWPLGSCSARGHSAMLNLIGALPSTESVLAVHGAHLHDYGKDPRPGRKVGHCTLVDADRTQLEERFRKLKDVVLGSETVTSLLETT
jgi:5-(carboxyamino)imidazole ribonucleotide synthase